MTDVIIIGAGHNGLTCAAYLARAGKEVLCLEAAEVSGGMSATRTFSNNYQIPGLALHSYPLSPNICRDLKLNKHGYRTGPSIQTIALDADGAHLTVGTDKISGANLSASDIQAYPKFMSEYLAFAKALNPIFKNRPPRLKDMDFTDKKSLAKLGWNMRFGLGRDSMYEFLRVAAINIYDVLNETFENEQLKACLALDATLGSSMGPRTPGSVLTWLHRLQGAFNGPLSLNGAAGSNLVESLQNSAEAFGAVIRHNAKVKRILVEDDSAVGVELESGEKLMAELVVSNADPRTTFLSLVGAPKLDANFANRAMQIRGSGVVAKFNIALSGLPDFKGIDKDQMGNRFIIAPSMRYIEKAFNHSKYGEYSKHPVLEFGLPTTHNKDLAVKGHHILSANVAYVPYMPAQEWQQFKDEFSQQLISLLDDYAPGLKSLAVSYELLLPTDIEEQYLATQGHWHHAEMSIHQSLMLRPLHGASQYNTPINNLFLCGAGSHPGGDLTALPGHNAAKRVLEMGVVK